MSVNRRIVFAGLVTLSALAVLIPSVAGPLDRAAYSRPFACHSDFFLFEPDGSMPTSALVDYGNIARLPRISVADLPAPDCVYYRARIKRWRFFPGQELDLVEIEFAEWKELCDTGAIPD